MKRRTDCGRLVATGVTPDRRWCLDRPNAAQASSLHLELGQFGMLGARASSLHCRFDPRGASPD